MSKLLDVNSGLSDIHEFSYEDFQEQSALMWANRAAAAYLLSIKAEDAKSSLHWIEYGNEFTLLARTHANAIEDGGILASHIAQDLSSYKDSALLSLLWDSGLEEQQTESASEENEESDSEHAAESGATATDSAVGNEKAEEIVAQS